jgi:fimbrial chaperone protein
MRIRPLALLLGAATTVCGPVSAASLRISPIGLDLVASQRAAALTLVNTDADPVNLQIRIFKWTQVDGQDMLEPASDMMVSPPAAAVPAGASYTVRVARPSTASVQHEQAYRLFIDELPKPVDPRAVGQGVAMVLRTSMPVFVTSPKAVAQLHWRVWQSSDGLHVDVSNDGQRHAKISGLTVQPVDGAPIVFGAGLNGYVLAGTSKSFLLKSADAPNLPSLVPGASVTLTAKNDALSIKEQLSVVAK